MRETKLECRRCPHTFVLVAKEFFTAAQLAPISRIQVQPDATRPTVSIGLTTLTQQPGNGKPWEVLDSDSVGDAGAATAISARHKRAEKKGLLQKLHEELKRAEDELLVKRS